MEIRYTNFKHCPFYLLNHETYETNCLIHILLCKYIIDLKALSPLRSSTWSHENRVSKHFAFSLNFPCLSLVAYVDTIFGIIRKLAKGFIRGKKLRLVHDAIFQKTAEKQKVV